MTCFRPYNPEQTQLFGYVDPEDRLPEDHQARFVDEVVEKLDLSDIEQAYSIKGCKGYDPRLLMRIFLFGYMEGITSSRRLMRSCQRDMAFVFLCRGQAPDFRTIARFRRVFRTQISALFRQVVALAMEMGMGKLRRVAVDSTTIKASASAGATLTPAKVAEELKTVEKFLGEMEANDKAEDKAFGKERRGDELAPELATAEQRRRKMEEVLEKQRQLKQAQEEMEAGRRKTVNSTDPECALRRDGATGRIVPAYGCQAAMSEDHVIVAASAGTEDDGAALCSIVQQVRENAISAKAPGETNPLAETELYADANYYSVNNIEKLGQQDITPVIPDQISSARMQGKRAPTPREGFTYDAEMKSFQCPAGHQLTFTRETVDTRYGKQRTRNTYANPEACRNCPMREQCCGKAAYKQLRVTGDPAKTEVYLGKFSEPAMEEKYKFRRSIEKLFGHMKGNLRFRQFLCRGAEMIAAEWSLLCMSFNALRIYNEVWRQSRMAA